MLAEAAAAVAEVEQSSPAAAEGGAAVHSPTSAPRSYASLVACPPPPPHVSSLPCIALCLFALYLLYLPRLCDARHSAHSCISAQAQQGVSALQPGAAAETIVLLPIWHG